MYTLPPLASPEGERQAKKGGDDPVVRSWTITSVHGDDSPLEITVQAKVRSGHEVNPCSHMRMKKGGYDVLSEVFGSCSRSHKTHEQHTAIDR